jgi:hypothetical protein
MNLRKKIKLNKSNNNFLKIIIIRPKKKKHIDNLVLRNKYYIYISNNSHLFIYIYI